MTVALLTKSSRAKNDSSKTWKLYNEMIGEVNDKSSISDFFVLNGKHVSDKRAVAAEFNHYFTNIRKSVASKPWDGGGGGSKLPQKIDFKQLYMNLTNTVGNIYLPK